VYRWKLSSSSATSTTTINVQVQVQMATTCIPGNSLDVAAYRIQSVFFATHLMAMVNEIYPVLRNIDSPFFKVLRPVIEYVNGLRDSGLEIAHLEVVPFENGVYTFTPLLSQTAVLDTHPAVGTQVGGAAILEVRQFDLPPAANSDVLQLSVILLSWPAILAIGLEPSTPHLSVSWDAKKYTTIEFDNPYWLAANYPLMNPHAHPSYSQSMVEFDPGIGDFTSKQLMKMKVWRFQDQFQAKPGSGTVSPLHFGGVVSKETSCSISSYIIYGRGARLTPAWSLSAA